MDLPFALPRLPARSRWGTSGKRRASRPRTVRDRTGRSRPGVVVALRRPRLRTMLALAFAFAVLAGGWLWLRDSSLVAVRQVRIAGVRHGPQAHEIEAALRASAREMTTMHFDRAALREAVRGFPVVKAIAVSIGFPHTVRIRVLERRPVAVLLADGQRTAVGEDGTILGAALVSAGTLPSVAGSSFPPTGRRVGEANVAAAVGVMAAAPSSLVRFVAKIYSGPEGLTAAMRNGLLVYFGDARRAHAKWRSLVAVLADPSSAGATYVDVRVPEHPAAGGGTTEALGAASIVASPSAGSTASAVEELAERLATGSGVEAAGGTEPASAAGEQASPSSTEGGEASEGSTASAGEAAAGAGSAPAGEETSASGGSSSSAATPVPASSGASAAGAAEAP